MKKSLSQIRTTNMMFNGNLEDQIAHNVACSFIKELNDKKEWAKSAGKDFIEKYHESGWYERFAVATLENKLKEYKDECINENIRSNISTFLRAALDLCDDSLKNDSLFLKILFNDFLYRHDPYIFEFCVERLPADHLPNLIFDRKCYVLRCPVNNTRFLKNLVEILKQVHFSSKVDLSEQTIKIDFGRSKRVMDNRQKRFQEVWNGLSFAKLLSLYNRPIEFNGLTHFYDLINLVKFLEVDRIIELDPYEMFSLVGTQRLISPINLQDDTYPYLDENEKPNKWASFRIELLGCYIKNININLLIHNPRDMIIRQHTSNSDVNIIFLCPDNIRYFCKIYGLDDEVVRPLVEIHEFGHLVFSFREDHDHLSVKEREQQANWFASYFYDGAIDEEIRKVIDKQPSDYQDPLLFSDYLRKVINDDTIKSLYEEKSNENKV